MMSEQMPQPQLPEELHDFDRLEAKVASDGSRRIYGIDNDGKKRQLKGDDVLEAYGYSVDEAQEARNAQDVMSEFVGQDDITERTDTHKKINDIKGKVAEIEEKRKEHAKWHMKVATGENKPSERGVSADDVAYNMWLEENAQNPESTSKTLGEKAAELKADEEKERMRDFARLSMRVKTGAATGEEAAYYYALQGSAEADKQAKVTQDTATDNNMSEVNKHGKESVTKDDLTALADKIALATVKGDEALLKELQGKSSDGFARFAGESNMTESEKHDLLAELRGRQNNTLDNLLANLGNLDLTESERAHAEVVKKEHIKLLELEVNELVTEQVGNQLADKTSLLEINEQINHLLDRYQRVTGITDERKRTIRNRIDKRLLAVAGNNGRTAQPRQEAASDSMESTADDTVEPYQPKHLRQQGRQGIFARIKDKWEALGQRKRRGYGMAAGIGVLAVGTLLLSGDVDNGRVDLAPSFIDGDGMGLDVAGDRGEPMDLNGSNPGTSAPEETGGSDASIEDDQTGVGNGDGDASNETTEANQGATFTVEQGHGYTQELQDAFPGHSPAQYLAAHEAALEEFGPDYLQGVGTYQTEAGEQRLANPGTGSWSADVADFLRNRLG